MAQKPITIYDIAKEAQVSPSTVSRILSNSTLVSQEKREKVLQVIEKHHFKPNALAKGLSDTHSKRIGMLCPDVRNPFYANVYTECERAAYDRGYTVVFNNTFGQEELEIDSINRMLEQRVECMIISGGVIDWNPLPEEFEATLKHLCEAVPVIVNGYLPGLEKKCGQYVLDAYGGMRQAVNHLAALGHKRIAFLHGLEHIYQTQIKKKAYKESLENVDLPVKEEYMVNAGLFNEKSGFVGMNHLLSLPEPPTAVIAINDLMAVGALQALLKIGYTVPGDFSLIGFDDSYLTELTQPNLTSVHCDYTMLGKILIEAAVNAIGGVPFSEPQYLPMSLKIRDSCKKMGG